MQAALDMLRERELIAVLAAFAGAGIGTLLLKGAALAYSHYPEPALRTRCDADVLIRPADRDAAMRICSKRLGYRRPERGQRHAGELRGVPCEAGGPASTT